MSKIILDACNNHLGNTDIIRSMIKHAKECGADFIKFQAYDVDMLNTDVWGQKYEYYKSNQLTLIQYDMITSLCRDIGLDLMFTIFHKSMIDVLCKFDVKYVKIASPDAGKLYLLESVLERFDNVIISCGMLTTDEYARLCRFIRNWNDKNIKLLYCVSKYPTTFEDIDFKLMSTFDGFSDHTPDIKAAKMAVSMSMEYIERHYTLGKFLPGADHTFSSTPDEIKDLTNYRTYLDNIDKYKRRFLN